MLKSEASINFKNALQDFTSDTTLHGIKYPFGEKYGIIRRCIWCVLILGLAAALITTLVQSLIKYYKYESVTSSTPYVSKNISMPAITICPQFIINNKSIYTNYAEIADEIIQYVLPVMLNTIIVAQLPENVVEFMKRQKVSSFYKNVASNHSYVSCRLQNTIINCRDFLQVSGTDQGVCNTFHSQAYIDKNGPIMVKKAGPNNGVTFLLDAEPDEEITPISYGTGFRVLIHDPKVYPLMEERSFVVGTGTETFVALQKSVSRYLRVPYSENDCVNSENLHLYQNYTLNNVYSSEGCTIECTTRIIYDCNCSVAFDGNYDSCTLYDFITCANERYQSISPSYIIEKCANLCIPNCEETNYITQVTQMPFPNKLAVQNAIRDNLPVKTKEEMNSRYMELKVYFENLRYNVNEQVPTTDRGDLFSSFGGLMGLFIGASIITILEFIDFFIIFLMKKFNWDQIYNNSKKECTTSVNDRS